MSFAIIHNEFSNNNPGFAVHEGLVGFSQGTHNVTASLVPNELRQVFRIDGMEKRDYIVALF